MIIDLFGEALELDEIVLIGPIHFGASSSNREPAFMNHNRAHFNICFKNENYNRTYTLYGSELYSNSVIKWIDTPPHMYQDRLNEIKKRVEKLRNQIIRAWVHCDPTGGEIDTVSKIYKFSFDTTFENQINLKKENA